MDYRKVIQIEEELKVLKKQKRIVRKQAIMKRAELMMNSFTGRVPSAEKALTEVKILEQQERDILDTLAVKSTELKKAMASA